MVSPSPANINDLWVAWLTGTLSPAPSVSTSGASGSTGTPTYAADISVDNTAGGVQLLASNASRKSALIVNTGTASMRVAIGTNPTSTTGTQVQAGAALSLDQPFVPTGQVKAIREGANNTTAAVVEVT